MSSDSSGFLGGVALLVLVGLFGTGWVFDLYDLLKSEGASASPVTAPDVTLPAEVTVTLPADGTAPAASTSSTTSTTVVVTDSTIPTSVTAATTAAASSTAVPAASTTVAAPAVYAPAPTWDNPFPAPTAADYDEAWARLETLTVAPANTAAGYSRSAWMSGWYPAAGTPVGAPPLPSGCDVRQFEFNLWARPGSYQADSTCRATAGAYFDGYLGVSYTIPADRAVSKVDVEHVVALAEAHRSGGDTWTAAEKNALAMDWTVRSYHDGGTQLFLTDANENQHVKSDDDPAGYLPAAGTSRCGFVVDHIAVKARYGLAVDAEEASALVDALTVCQAGGTPDRP